MTLTRCLPALLCLLLAVPLACADDRPELVIGYYDFPPSIDTDARGRAHGELVDLVLRVAERAGYRPVFRGLPSARLYGALREGSVDVWPGAPDKPELEDDTVEGEQVLSEVYLNLYFRRDTLLPRIPDDLAGQGLIVLNGYNYAPQVDEILHAPGVRLHRASTHVSAVGMLMHRRGDFLLDYELPVSQARARLNAPELPFVVLHRMPIRFIASRRAPGATRKLADLDRAYAEMVRRGEPVNLRRR
ncbi:substrate-binding periplasmic protein [Stutzerimonas azotifigens]|uniref:substrate-binding periplasmic protein n=1 Tax=Stutzerimonas azotifigens TaxID=291995 RepID=UPI0006869AE4|nr:transporter substrate-binding domain-containing protein [Stutzerimonas azotifigens]